uniref:Uncharacterized protein n=1 Tax=Eutreptiella gymnastica TaxID=73025 RepID=A0A7S1IH90_9EUGL
MLPPVSKDEGSTAMTATLCPSDKRCIPSPSIIVDFPAPGAPLMPTLNDGRRCCNACTNNSSACCRCSRFADSTIVKAFPKARRFPLCILLKKSFESCERVQN